MYHRTPLVGLFLEAARILGHPILDYNTPEKLGFGYLQLTTESGRRVSSAKAYLHSNKRRSNLHILIETRATKVLIDNDTKAAVGVEYVRNRMSQTVMARREVILSAGPIASPQLLMLSGVGPQEHLTNLGIRVIQDLPVGRTLYDHISFPGLVYTLNVTGVSLLEGRETTLYNTLQWFQFGDGPATAAGGAEAIGYIKTPSTDEPQQVPDIELLSIGGSLVSDGGAGNSKSVRRGMMISDAVFDPAYGSIDNTDTWSSFLMLLHPKSVGYLELRDTNPFSFPRMYGNYLTDPRDVRTFIEGIRHVQALAETEPFQRIGAQIHRARYPTCRKFKFDSDAYWECAIRTLTATLHHQIATCRMGPEGDPRAVVDPELRVHGIQRLRVVDSSIIPRTTCAHTHAPAVMIGEKAADMIKATWSQVSEGYKGTGSANLDKITYDDDKTDDYEKYFLNNDG